MKLGKLAPKKHSKTLLFSKYLLADAPPPPPEKTYWEYKVNPSTIGMYGNDTIGDCTCAAVAHYIILATAHTGKVVFPEVEDVIKMYSAITGYDPSQTDANGNNPTDTGAAITDVLNYWQTTGLAGHKILGWAEIEYSNLLMRHQGIHIFGANDTGVNLPNAATTQFSDNQSWEVVPNDTIDGGHCIIEAGYGSEGSDFQTWGKGDQKASSAWSSTYMDEAYVVITQDWVDNATGLAPNTLNMDELRKDLAEIGDK